MEFEHNNRCCTTPIQPTAKFQVSRNGTRYVQALFWVNLQSWPVLTLRRLLFAENSPSAKKNFHLLSSFGSFEKKNEHGTQQF